MTKTYIEKLKDPQWQKKRLEIFNRDNWTCQKCGDKNTTLNVHHRYYLKDKEPWEYPDDALITLCEPCHMVEKPSYDFAGKLMINTLKATFWGEDLIQIASAFSCLKGCPPKESTELANAISYAISRPEALKLMVEEWKEQTTRLQAADALRRKRK